MGNPPANSTFETICFTLLKSIICRYCWLLIKAAASWYQIYGWYLIWVSFYFQKSNIWSGCTKHICCSKNSMNIVAVSKLWHVWSFKKVYETLGWLWGECTVWKGIKIRREENFCEIYINSWIHSWQDWIKKSGRKMIGTCFWIIV